MTAGRKSAKSPKPRKPRAARPEARARAPSTLIELSGDHTQQNAESLKAQLLKEAARRGTVTLDAGEMRRVDAAALQLLLAFVRDRKAKDLTTEWKAVADPLADAAQRLALHDALGLSAASTSPR